jgi:hypothetical protein
LAELNTTIKRYSPHTSITTPSGLSLPGSPFKSNPPTVPSTPLFANNIILAVQESEIRQTPATEAEVHQTPTTEAKIEHQPPNLTPVVTGIVENPQLLTAGLASTDNIEFRREAKTDTNNNEYTIVLDESNENDSMI